MSKKTPYTETELIALLGKRDESAFDALYNSYSPALYGIICRIVGSEEAAQDVLQDSFVKIWNRFASYDTSKGSLFTWMLNIARNTAIDYTRSGHARHQIQNDRPVVSMSDETPSDTRLEHIGLKEVVSSLKDEHKLVIELIYLQGYTQEETAKKLNIPLGTVKTRARTAIMQLQLLLNEKQTGR